MLDIDKIIVAAFFSLIIISFVFIFTTFSIFFLLIFLNRPLFSP
jgi:hypothetical protein